MLIWWHTPFFTFFHFTKYVICVMMMKCLASNYFFYGESLVEYFGVLVNRFVLRSFIAGTIS